MKLDLFKEKHFDLVVFNNQSVTYFRIEAQKTKINILKSEKIEANIYSQGVFHLQNLQPALEILFKKYKLTELGIVLNTPNIIFQKITIPRTTAIREAIISYLKTNSPLPIEKYALFYQEDKYHSFTTMATYKIFLIDKEIINHLLEIVEKYSLMPIFISPMIEIFYHYLLNKTILDFNEEYLVFLEIEKTLIATLIRNFRLEKMISEEVDSQKAPLDLTLDRIYDFLKTEIKSQAKVIFFLEEKLKFTGSHQFLFFPSATINTVLEGSYLTFKDVLLEKQIINFMPIKNYKAYFYNRLPSIIALFSIYTLALLSLISLSYFLLQAKFDREIKQLSSQTTLKYSNQNEEQLQNLKKFLSLIQPEIFDKFSLILKIKKLSGLESINFENQEIIFNLKTDRENLEKTKFEISQNFPSAKLIEETNLQNEVKLKYSLQNENLPNLP